MFAILLAAAIAAPLTGNAIFAAAQTAASHASYPAYASYTVNVAFADGTQRVHDSWQTIEDIKGATVLAGLFSAQEVANPAVPHGTNVDVQVFGNLNPPQQRDPIGNVTFAIDQTFGVAPLRSYVTGRELNSPAPASHLFRVVGRAAGATPLYNAQLVDTVPGDHGSDYHLKLTPLTDPGTNRLRELWVATDTMALDAAVVAGIGNRPPASKILWKVSFGSLAGAPILAREVALAPLDYGTQDILRDVTIDFTDVEPAPQYPDRYQIGEQAADALRDP
jgi:hypothetical protein